ncbi:chromosomal replication initiator protein DnaA [Actinomarinicola tropica]|uniref:chromosomal replication initiator protein DnaA n=1 Tax=Actinomarinicola tropica TaxID=2789776 RepID=UPI001E52A66C|nr:chromosomal replication initiator protein DnaA [Actinomarinicola tropica]
MREAGAVWGACSEFLRSQVSEAVWLTSFSSAQPLALDHGVLTVAVPSSVVKERIEGRYLALVRDALDEAGANDLALAIEVRTELGDGPSGPADELVPPPDVDRLLTEVNGGPSSTEDLVAPVVAAPAPAPGPLDEPRYTFEAFVIGSSNRFAHAAALSVAEQPGRSYNPLFIHGHAGLGKTHLLQAIAHYVRNVYPRSTVRYVTTENFLNQFVEAIRTNTPNDFKRRYREIDVLLLDDIQFIEGREGLQEELFHTFNHLHDANRQIVLSSDRPPDAMSTLEDRLRSRFKMGLITDIQPPDFETRLAIVRKKAERETTWIPPDVLEFIATHVKDNIRELEGALIRVSAFANLTKEDLSADLAERVLGDLIGDTQPRVITPELILDATSKMFGYPIEEITGKSRRRPLVTARQIAMYVFRELTDLSFPAIAREFGGRDHTTVIHAVEKISALMKERRQIYDQVTELMTTIRGGE